MPKITKQQAKEVGEALRVDWRLIDLEQFRMGLEVELEHTDVTGGDLELTGMIALVHLEELPDYYTRLKRMETRRKPNTQKGWQKVQDLVDQIKTDDTFSNYLDYSQRELTSKHPELSPAEINEFQRRLRGTAVVVKQEEGW